MDLTVKPPSHLLPCLFKQPYFMFIGLYTLYGGILLTYDNIPAWFRWIYYTNPGRLVSMHTQYFCEITILPTVLHEQIAPRAQHV